jgi:amino acid transporter
MYALGRERVLPRRLGATHPVHRSPHVASILQSLIAFAIVLLFIWRAPVAKGGSALTVAYLQVYGLMAVMGVFSILAIQALVSVAIIIYFQRHHAADTHWWTTLAAPIIAALTQAVVVVLAYHELDFLGAGYWYAKWLVVADLVIFAGGIVYAFWLRSARPQTYELVGRMVDDSGDGEAAEAR